MTVVDKALVFIFLIFLGWLLQRKVKEGRELNGLKILILSVALPATIFIALLSIRFDAEYLFLPLGAIVFNLLMFGLLKLFAPMFGLSKDSKEYRTALMLFPSLAPGLSCFPFLAEYLGEEGLALGALADVGNKVFVLIILYLIAMHWYQQSSVDGHQGRSKLKSLLISMINEPINIVIIIALVMVASGWGLESLPAFLSEGISRGSMIMTPLILLFIGLSVRVNWRELRRLFFLLSWRSGIAFIASAALIAVLPGISHVLAMLIIVFPQSSASFWPYAHMTSINQLGEKEIFDTRMAISFLACSLPFSTLVIMGVFSFGQFMVNPWFLFGIGTVIIIISILPRLIRRLMTSRSASAHVPESSNYQYAE